MVPGCYQDARQVQRRRCGQSQVVSGRRGDPTQKAIHMLTMQHIARNRNMSSAHRRLAAPSAKTQEEELLEEVKTLDESSPELETPSSSERPCPRRAAPGCGKQRRHFCHSGLSALVLKRRVLPYKIPHAVDHNSSCILRLIWTMRSPGPRVTVLTTKGLDASCARAAKSENCRRKASIFAFCRAGKHDSAAACASSPWPAATSLEP